LRTIFLAAQTGWPTIGENVGAYLETMKFSTNAYCQEAAKLDSGSQGSTDVLHEQSSAPAHLVSTAEEHSSLVAPDFDITGPSAAYNHTPAEDEGIEMHNTPSCISPEEDEGDIKMPDSSIFILPAEHDDTTMPDNPFDPVYEKILALGFIFTPTLNQEIEMTSGVN
jgi:hypothetical protein